MRFCTDKNGNSGLLCRLHKRSRRNVAFPCKWFFDNLNQDMETKSAMSKRRLTARHLELDHRIDAQA